MGIKRIHVNQHHVRSNKTKDTDLPVITIKEGRKNTYCNEVEILGPSKIKYCGIGNEYNQTFGPVMSDGYGIDGFSFKIFNRWGEIIWESKDVHAKWDGYYNGRICQDGLYIWSLKFSIFGNDGKISDIGHLTIIR